jgi:Domain of unknown function (DUF4434)
MRKMNRRNFVHALGAGGALITACTNNAEPLPASNAVKPISGSWFEFQHHATVEGVDSNSRCARSSCARLDTKVKEMAGIGMEYLVMMATALDYRAFYPTKIFPPWQLACADPVAAVLTAADKYGVKFFIGGGFYSDRESPKNRFRSRGSAETFAGHRSACAPLRPSQKLIWMVLAQRGVY